jgi:hypothetical protein
MPRSPVALYEPYHPAFGPQRFIDHEARGNGLRIACWDCEHEVELTGTTLVDRFGGETTLADLWPRLRCSACRVGRVHAYPIGMGGSRHPGPVVYREHKASPGQQKR